MRSVSALSCGSAQFGRARVKLAARAARPRTCTSPARSRWPEGSGVSFQHGLDMGRAGGRGQTPSSRMRPMSQGRAQPQRQRARHGKRSQAGPRRCPTGRPAARMSSAKAATEPRHRAPPRTASPATPADVKRPRSKPRRAACEIDVGPQWRHQPAAEKPRPMLPVVAQIGGGHGHQGGAVMGEGRRGARP